MATNPFEKFRTKIAEGLFALNTKLFADGEKVSGDNPLPMKQYGSIGASVIKSHFNTASFSPDTERDQVDILTPFELLGLEIRSNYPQDLQFQMESDNDRILPRIDLDDGHTTKEWVSMEEIIQENYLAGYFQQVANIENRLILKPNINIPFPKGGKIILRNNRDEEIRVGFNALIRKWQ